MYKIIPTERFEKDVNYLTKKKGFIHITEDIKAVTDELEKGNLIGKEIPGVKIGADRHIYKVRSSNTDTKVGKSNGYRILYYVVKSDGKIYLLRIYYKKEDNKIPTNQEIITLAEIYCK